MESRRIGVIGNDRRYAALAELLARDGHSVLYRGGPPEESLWEALEGEIVILPFPLCGADGLLNLSGVSVPVEAVLDRLRPEQAVLAGQIPEPWVREAERRGQRLLDYMTWEPLAVANAAATADAAIVTAMERLEQTMTGKRCLVIGFGRIGKLLCQRLRGVSADVTAAARRTEDRAWIRVLGYDALDTGSLSGLSRFDVVYNTVPAPVLRRAALRELPPSCLLVDLASRPGIDFAAAAELGLDSIQARGLPGKRVPRTAAAALRDAVYGMTDMIREDEPS